MRRILLYIVLLIGGVTANATNPTRGGDGDDNDVFTYFFHEAQRQMHAENYDAAFDLLNFCLKLNPNSAASLYSVADINHFLRRDSLAISQMEKAVELDPDNYWYKDHLVKLYFNNKRVDEAQTLLEKMAVQFPDKEEVLMMLLDLYTSNSDYAKVLKIMEKIELKEGKSEQLSLEKARIYAEMKDEKSAIREMQALAEEYPNDLRYQVLIGDLYLDQGKKSEAMKIYKSVEEKEPDNFALAVSMLRYYEHSENDSLYEMQLAKLVTHPKIDDDTRMKLLGSLTYSNLQNNGDSTRIIRLFDQALALPQKDAQLYELYARYMVTRRMPSENLKPVLHKMLEIDPENEVARNQLLLCAVEEEDTMAIIHVCKPAVDYSIDDVVFYYYLGLAYYQTDSISLGIETYRKGLEKIHGKESENITITTNMYTLLGDLYHKAGQADKCFEAYDSCLIYRPDDALVLNNYAYYLCLEKKDLKRAEMMSRRSLELDADNPTYLDTLAWILFMQKRYAEAKEVMDKAVEMFGDEINDDDNDGIRSHLEQINEKVKKK